MKKLKLLVLGPAPFVPENQNGVNKTTYNLLKNHSELEVVFMYPSLEATPFIMGEGFEHVTLHPVMTRGLKTSSLGAKVRSLFSVRPFISDSLAHCRQLVREIEKIPTDFIVIMGLGQAFVLALLPPRLHAQVILAPIDCLTLFYRSRLQNEANLLKKLLWGFDAFKAYFFEKKLYRLSRRNLFVSKKDAQVAQDISGGECLGIPYGVDLAKFDQEYLNETPWLLKDDIIFTGNFDYAPNIQGALFLIEEVMPLLRQKGLKLRLILAGGNPVPEIKRHACDDIIVTGFVDSLVPLIAQSKIFLSPIFFGAGVKTKVLEAMYLERVVLGTPESFFAIEAKDQVEVIEIQDRKSPEAWALKIFEVWKDFEAYQIIGKRARQAIIDYHSWPSVRSTYRKQLY